ncbi:ABC transporter substrate-binding protein [Natronoflexus pectinivorans]|uniref:Iron complex transport system substrate-binding protein n=1 Tax=Natronoflexus pectinivorans TaxID=682526 RepID=A0A4R2GC40_9BACT|nr:ABC transporter substrate-binding protein [Natronoflexus pectinivorans]TCO05410.1 iron complex transport system substrate-binding protein [Natronoflexus pectinivorans]
MINAKQILSILFVLIVGCGNPQSRIAQETVTITDMADRKVTIPVNIESIVGLKSGALRMLVYMGLTEKISGVEDIERRPGRAYAFAQPQLTEKPIIGPMHGGDAELIAINAPDVIFMTNATIGEANDLQRRTGIPVVVIKPGNLTNQRSDFNKSLKTIGTVTGTESRADSVIHFIDNQIAELNKVSAKTHKKNETVYAGGISYSGSRSITSTIPLFDVFIFVNAENVAAELAQRSNLPLTIGSTVEIDIEQLITWNPDRIFVDAAGRELVLPQIANGTPLQATLQAVQNNKVHFLMPHNWYSTNFETVLTNAWYVASILYPDAVTPLMFKEKSTSIYEYMLGNDVSEELIKMYNGWTCMQ